MLPLSLSAPNIMLSPPVVYGSPFPFVCHECRSSISILIMSETFLCWGFMMTNFLPLTNNRGNTAFKGLPRDTRGHQVLSLFLHKQVNWLLKESECWVGRGASMCTETQYHGYLKLFSSPLEILQRVDKPPKEFIFLCWLE